MGKFSSGGLQQFLYCDDWTFFSFSALGSSKSTPNLQFSRFEMFFCVCADVEISPVSFFDTSEMIITPAVCHLQRLGNMNSWWMSWLISSSFNSQCCISWWSPPPRTVRTCFTDFDDPPNVSLSPFLNTVCFGCPRGRSMPVATQKIGRLRLEAEAKWLDVAWAEFSPLRRVEER